MQIPVHLRHTAAVWTLERTDSPGGTPNRRQCLYTAATDDNGESRGELRIYRVREPDLPAVSSATSPAEVLELHYPDGPHDVEAAFVGGDGTVFLISKGRDGTARAYRVPA